MSNLLKDASILLTPTGYDNGSMNAIKPENGDGDFTFVRGSAATRVNAQGLVENVQIISSELVTNGNFSQIGLQLVINGDFAADTNWSKDANWTIANGKATSTGNGRMFQSIPFLEVNVGVSVKVTFDILELTQGGVQVNCYGGISQTFTTLGTHTFFTTTTNGSNLYFNNGGAGSNFIGSIDNCSVKQVGQGWTVINGNITDKYNASMTAYQSGIRVSPFNKTGKFKVLFDLVITSGNMKFDAGGVNNQTYTTSGTKEIIIINPTKFEFNAFNLGWVGTLDNVSVKEVTDDTNIPRINYEGFSYQDSLGSELVTNGDFSNGSANWIIENTWTISDGVANGNGANGTSEELSQSNVVTIGKTYSISYEVKNYVSGIIRLRKPQTINRNANGTYTETVTATSDQFIFSPSNFNGSITNISVKEYLGQEVVPDSGSGSWLLEPQSTNLITYSEDFSKWSLSGGSGGSSVPNSVISPDGTQNASSWITNAIGQRIQKSTSGVTNGNAYTFSIYIKADTNLNVGITWADNSPLSVAVTNEWQRFEVTQNASGTTGYPQLRNIGDNGTFYIWGAQLEEQSFATSYIPTEGATNTRNRDLATDSGNATLINSTEGTIYFEGSALANNGTSRRISLSDGSIRNRVSLEFDETSNRIKAFISSEAISQVLEYNSSNLLQFNKIAISYKLNDMSIWFNGSKVATDTSGNMPIGLNKLAFDNGSAGQFFFGKAKCLAVYKEALTDAELQCLTTI